MSDKRRAVEWTCLRISKDTKARLEALRETWVELANLTTEPLGSSATRSGQASRRDQIGLDQVIRRLIRLHERHAERRSRANGRKVVSK